MFSVKAKACEIHMHKNDTTQCEKCIEESIREDKVFSVSIFILTRIGLDVPNPEYLEVLDEIMMLSAFQGVVGGSPARALFILGRVGTDYIYLDPHYVQVDLFFILQEATTRKGIVLNEATFQCNDLHLLP